MGAGMRLLSLVYSRRTKKEVKCSFCTFRNVLESLSQFSSISSDPNFLFVIPIFLSIYISVYHSPPPEKDCFSLIMEFFAGEICSPRSRLKDFSSHS